jgi:hypothetical protein
MKAMIFLLLFLSATACRADEESCKAAAEPANVRDRSWHLLTITHGGTVTLLKGLTKHEAEFARARALNRPATVKECEEAAADEKRRREAEAAREEAELREWKKTAPACPKAGASKTPDSTLAIEVHGDGCVDAEGNPHRWIYPPSFSSFTWAPGPQSGDIESAEVFR